MLIDVLDMLLFFIFLLANMKAKPRLRFYVCERVGGAGMQSERSKGASKKLLCNSKWQSYSFF